MTSIRERIKITKKDTSREDRLLTGMIVSDEFLGKILRMLDKTLLETPYAKVIVEWCESYYDRYRKAPGLHVQDLYRAWKKEYPDESFVELLGGFLARLSETYETWEGVNVPYLLDEAEKLLQEQYLMHVADGVKTKVLQGDLLGAQSLISNYKIPRQEHSGGVNPLADVDFIREAFTEDLEELITFPGPLGDLVNQQLTRDSFVSFLAPEKRGKTFWLSGFALQALKCKRNVAYLAVGDMTMKQMARRFHKYLSKKGYRERDKGEILIPVLDCVWNQYDVCTKKARRSKTGVMYRGKDGDFKMCLFEDGVPAKTGFIRKDTGIPITGELADPHYVPCVYCRKREPKEFSGAIWFKKETIDHELTWDEGYLLAKKFLSGVKGRELRLEAYPNNNLNVKKIREQLNIWESRDGFIPDVIIIDYADNLGPEDGRKEHRNQINETWQSLRGLSMERHCLVITATQADARSYSKKSLSLENFSEDKRKYAHVTAMFALNQQEEEKELGIMRFGRLVVREEDFSVKDQTCVLQCLDIGRPFLDSFYPLSIQKIEERLRENDD
jgi:hypothetical protein